MNFRTDLALDTNNLYNIKKELFNKSIKVLEHKNNKNILHTIIFKSLINENNISKILKEELLYFFKLFNIDKSKHIFIVGLGNESNTADSIGPKVLKYINVNSHLFNLGINVNHIKISALEPGVLGTTGIDTSNIIKSVSKLIKPDLIILIDSFITSNIEYLNKTIEISNTGLKPGSGIRGTNSKISKSNIKIPIMTIGIPVCLEYKTSNKTLLVSTNDIDEYVITISKILGSTLNSLLYSI